MVDVVENLLAYVIEEEAVVDGGVSHCIVRAVVTSVESKFFDVIGFGVAKSGLLSVHFDDVLGALVDFLFVERPHSHCDLDAVCHESKF